VLEHVSIGSATETTAIIDGETLRVHHYKIDGQTHDKVCLSDPQQVPVMFSIDDGSGEIIVSDALLRQQRPHRHVLRPVAQKRRLSR
jgi:hypothetical protein